MGRPRKHFSTVIDKILKCKTCGKEWKCSGDAVSVQCDICSLGAKSVVNASYEIPKKSTPIAETKKNLSEEIVEAPKVKRGRGRPRKNPILPTDNKEKKMAKKSVEKNVEVKGGNGGKRGRKATVGAAVLGYIQGQKGEVKFTDILGVYSAEREKLGKKASEEVESRNCHSTLYVMVRDGKIREVTKKSVYAAC